MTMPKTRLSRWAKARAAGFFLAAAGGLLWLAGQVRVVAAFPQATLNQGHAPELVVARRDRLPEGNEARELLWLLDPGPLFLPGEEASSPARGDREPGRIGSEAGQGFPAALTFPLVRPARDVLRPRPPENALTASATLSAGRWLEGFARQDDADGEITADLSVARAARVEVYRVGGAGRVATVDIARAEELTRGAWKPVEWGVWVAGAGGVGAPVVVVSSGVGEIDERIRWIVGRELLPTLRLRSGVYRLEAGP